MALDSAVSAAALALVVMRDGGVSPEIYMIDKGYPYDRGFKF